MYSYTRRARKISKKALMLASITIIHKRLARWFANVFVIRRGK